MKAKHKRSLVWRVGIALIVIESIFTLLVGVYEYNNLKAYHLSQTEDLLRSVCHVVLGSDVDPFNSNDRERRQNLARSNPEETDFRVAILAANGDVLNDSHQDFAVMDNHSQREEILDATARGEGSSVRFSETLSQQTMYFALRIESEPDVVGFVRVATSVAHVNVQLRSVIRTITIGGLLWIGATIGSILFFSTKFSMTIERLGADASRLAIGDSKADPLESPGREFDPFVNSLNEMASLLQDRMNELRASQREQVTILRSMESGVITVDRDGHVFRLNPAAQEMLHIPEAHARGKTLAEIAPRSRLAAHVSEAFQSGRITTEEIEFSDHGLFIIRAASSVLLEPDGEAVGMLIMLTDITRLRRLESMRSEFAANVSHELRTPITNIQGFAETLLNVPPDDPQEQREFLEIISRNAVRLGSIVEDLLTLSRLEREEWQAGLDTLPTPLARVVTTVLDVLESRAEDVGVTFEVRVDPALVALINEHLIEQALTNLLTNAIRHSPTGGVIVISARSSTTDANSESITISVQDEGPGIPEEHLSRLFERFFRVDESRGRSEGGTGLGLAIVKHIVLVHSGSVNVTSEIGKGSTFQMMLPAR